MTTRRATTARRATLRGVKRGAMLASGDINYLRERRREIQQRDLVAEAWITVGNAISTAQTTTSRHGSAKA